MKHRFKKQKGYHSGIWGAERDWGVYDTVNDPLPDGDPIAVFKTATDATAFVRMKNGGS